MCVVAGDENSSAPSAKGPSLDESHNSSNSGEGGGDQVVKGDVSRVAMTSPHEHVPSRSPQRSLSRESQGCSRKVLENMKEERLDSIFKLLDDDDDGIIQVPVHHPTELASTVQRLQDPEVATLIVDALSWYASIQPSAKYGEEITRAHFKRACFDYFSNTGVHTSRKAFPWKTILAYDKASTYLLPRAATRALQAFQQSSTRGPPKMSAQTTIAVCIRFPCVLLVFLSTHAYCYVELLSDSLIEALTKSTNMEQAEPNYELSETTYGETLVVAGISPPSAALKNTNTTTDRTARNLAPRALAPGLSARETTTSEGKAGEERLRDLSMPREKREQRKAWLQVRAYFRRQMFFACPMPPCRSELADARRVESGNETETGGRGNVRMHIQTDGLQQCPYHGPLTRTKWSVQEAATHHHGGKGIANRMEDKSKFNFSFLQRALAPVSESRNLMSWKS